MSGKQSSLLLLRKGAVGQAYWPPSRTWHSIVIDKDPASLDEIEVHWHKQKDGARSTVNQDMLRCINVGGSDGLIYRGMVTMCRDHQVEGETDDFPGYRLGAVAAITGDPSSGTMGASGALKLLQIEFDFEASEGDDGSGGDDETPSLPPRKIAATGSDLLYWAVPRDLTVADAKSRMIASDLRMSSSEERGEEESSEDGRSRPARKRQATVKFDPAMFVASPKPRRTIIQDDDLSSDSSSSDDGSGFDRELFPESDEEGGGGSDRQKSPSADGGAASASSWGTPAASFDSQSQGSSWGVAVVTPDSGHGWGRSSSSARSSESRGSWGRSEGPNESNSWNASSSSSVSSALQFRKMHGSRSTWVDSKYLTKSEGKLEVLREVEEEFFLRWYFGSDQVKVVEVGLNQFDTIETRREVGNEVYTLVASKYEQGADDHGFRSRLGKFCGRPYAKCYYIAGDCRSVQKKLDNIANFSDLVLAPGKLASRLELLVSTAAAHSLGGEKTSCVYNLPTSHFEEIDKPENQTMGCGFIPSHMLEELLGNNNDAKDALAIQCRIVCPTLGVSVNKCSPFCFALFTAWLAL